MAKFPLVLTLGLLLTACGAPTPTAPDAAGETAALSAQTTPAPTMLSIPPSSPVFGADDALAQIALQYPAFGGYTVSDDNELVIFVAKNFNKKPIGEGPRGRSVGLIRKALLDLVGDAESPISAPGQAPKKLRDLKVRHTDVETSFADLQSWRLHLRNNLHRGLIAALSVDGAGNRVAVTLLGDDKRADFLALLDRLGVPPQSVALSVGKPGKTATLSSTVRPPVGGIEVRGRLTCTLGTNVSWNGLNGFLTAGHCSDIEAATDNGTFYQGRTSTGQPLAYAVGTENYEPGYSSAAFCKTESPEPSLPCRLSDVTFVQYSVPSNRARLIKTTETTNSITIATDAQGNPVEYDVTAAYGSELTLGTVLNNVGKRSGFKQAKVASLSADVYYGDYFHVNAVKMTAISGEAITCDGDSGGPWFSRTGTTTAKLAGIQFGGVTMVATPAYAKLEPGETGTITCYNDAYYTSVANIGKLFSGMAFTR